MTLDTDTGTADAAAGDDLYADIASAMRGEAPAEPGIGHNGGPEMDAEARARDERGRFSAAQPPDAAPAAAPPEGAQEQAGKPEPVAGSAPERLAPPTGWPADVKTQWDKLPRAAQEALKADLEAGKFAPAGQASGAPDPIRDALQPFEAVLAASGRQVAPFASNATQWALQYERDPRGVVVALAQQAGIDLAQLATPNAAQGGRQSPQVDPQLASAQQRIAQLEQRIAQREQTEQQQVLNSTAAEIAAWQEEADAAGGLLRPHVKDIDPDDFIARLQRVRTQNPHIPNRDVLQRAYEAEIYANPTIRQRILEAERKAETEKRAADERKTAEAARAKGVSVRNNPGPGNLAPQSADDLESVIRSAIRGNS